MARMKLSSTTLGKSLSLDAASNNLAFMGITATAQIKFRNPDGSSGASADVYANPTGGTPMSQPLNADDATADFPGWVECGFRYNALIILDGVPRTVPFDAPDIGIFAGSGFINSISDTATVNLTVTGTNLTADVAANQLGIGQAANTYRLSLPISTVDTGGVDFGGNPRVYTPAVGHLRVEAPTGSAILGVNAGTAGQIAQFQLSDGGTAKWVIRKAADNSFAFQDGSGNLVFSINASRQIFFDRATTASNLKAVRVGAGPLWDVTGTAVGSKIRLDLTTYNGFAGGVNSAAVTSDSTIAGSLTSNDIADSTFWQVSHGNHTFASKGTLVANGVDIAIQKPPGTFPNTYNEALGYAAGATSYNKGGLLGCFEAHMKIYNPTDNATAGPAKARAYWATLEERNDYSAYADPLIFDATSWPYRMGSIGYVVFSNGTRRVGTGIHLWTGGNVRADGGGALAAGQSGYVRAFTLADIAATEIFCIDGAGNMGIGAVTDHSTTLGAGLTLANGKNIILQTGTGTKIGTATTQKLGFWNKAPVVQPSLPASPTTADIKTLLQTIGLCA